MMKYLSNFTQPQKKSHTGLAMMAGIGIGAAAVAAGVYAWKKFKEANPDFSLKNCCDKCGLMFDDCDWDYDEEEECGCSHCSDTPHYEEESSENVTENSTDQESDSDDTSEENSDEDESGRRDLTGREPLTYEAAYDKLYQVVTQIYGDNIILLSDSDTKPVIISAGQEKRSCYLFWITPKEEDIVTPTAVFYVDSLTGEVFDNTNKDMKKICD